MPTNKVSNGKIIFHGDVSEPLPPDVIILKSGEYLIPVYKQALIDSSSFFQKMLSPQFPESKQNTIDLDKIFDQNKVKSLLDYLEQGNININTLDDAIYLLIIGDYICSQELINIALIKITELISADEFEMWIINKETLNPLLAKLITNFLLFRDTYPQNNCSAIKILQQLPATCLYSFEIYQTQMQQVTQILKKLTAVDWSFNGLTFTSNHRFYLTFNSQELNSEELYRNKVLNILIARNLLSAHIDEKYLPRESNPVCKVVDIERLLKLNPLQFHADIQNASVLLRDIISDADDPPLYIAPLCLGRVFPAQFPPFQALEKLGCIKMGTSRGSLATYSAPNWVNIINFDLEKLRLLKKEGIKFYEFYERYLLADEQRLNLEQICFQSISQQADTVHQNSNKQSAFMEKLKIVVNISNQEYGLYIQGTRGITDKLKEKVFKDSWFRNNEGPKVCLDSGVKYIAYSFFCGLFTLKAVCQTNPEQTIGQALIAFIDSYASEIKLDIEKSTQDLLEYWSFESQMIKNNFSYRSTMATTCSDLTSPTTLSVIIKKYFVNHNRNPDNKILFNFLEKSKEVTKMKYYCRPPLPSDEELEQFCNSTVENTSANNRYSFYHDNSATETVMKQNSPSPTQLQ